jgi:hypothetical protein
MLVIGDTEKIPPKSNNSEKRKMQNSNVPKVTERFPLIALKKNDKKRSKISAHIIPIERNGKVAESIITPNSG